MSSRTAAKRTVGTVGGCMLYPFFGMFLLIGSVGTYFFLVLALQEHFAVQKWVETPCVILESKFQRDDKQFKVNVTYEYEVAGELFQGNQFRSPNHIEKERISRSDKHWREQLKKGNRTVCYVDPDDPSSAVLDRKFSYFMLLGAIPLVFVAIGLGGLIAAPRMIAASRDPGAALAEALSQQDASRVSLFGALTGNLLKAEDPPGEIRKQDAWDVITAPSSPWLPAAETGPRELKASQSPWSMFLFLLFFALIWNGAVSIFVWNVISDWGQGKQPWFLTLFMIPFVLVGVGILGGAIYYLLATFNAKPQLFISSPSARPGEELRIKWVLRGRIQSLRNFTVKLIGEEWAQYRRGTSTYTDTHEFHEQEVYSTLDHYEMESGEAAVTIPEKAMHTVQANNNKIQWKLQLHGDVPLWPDIHAEFEITVLPQATTT